MEKKKLYKIIFISTLVLCVFSFIWAWWVTRGVRNNTAETLANQKVAINNLVLTETKDKKKYWELYSKRAEYDSSNSEVTLYGIIGNFYNDDGEVVLSFSSPISPLSHRILCWTPCATFWWLASVWPFCSGRTPPPVVWTLWPRS